VPHVPRITCVAVYCRVLQCGAVCCSVLRGVAVCCSATHNMCAHSCMCALTHACVGHTRYRDRVGHTSYLIYVSVLASVACVAVRCSATHDISFMCNSVACVAVCCSVLQCVAVPHMTSHLCVIACLSIDVCESTS